MVRIFRHYLSARLIFVVALEAMVFLLAIRLGLTFTMSHAPAAENALALLPTVTFVGAMLVVMNAMGLYSAEQWLDINAVRVRLIAAATLVLAMLLVATNLPASVRIEPHGYLVTGLAIFVGITGIRYAVSK